MSSERWSDDDLRRYVLNADHLYWLPPEQSDEPRAECRSQLARIVPAIQSRVLAEVGAVTSAEGIALLATELLENSKSPRLRWLVVSVEPWRYLEDWIVGELTEIYERVRKLRKDKLVLDGIEAASSRRELE